MGTKKSNSTPDRAPAKPEIRLFLFYSIKGPYSGAISGYAAAGSLLYSNFLYLVISQIEQLNSGNIFHILICQFLDPVKAEVKFFHVRTISKSRNHFDLIVMKINLFQSVGQFN